PEGPLRGVQGVRDRQELHERAELDARADLDRLAVQDDAPRVGVEALSDGDVRPVVAVERRLDRRARAEAAEQLAQERGAVIALVVGAPVVARQQCLRTRSRACALGLERVVELSHRPFSATSTKTL